MSRSYHEQVEVRLGPAREHGVRLEGALPTGLEGEQHVPALFLWRGRLHLVRVVLAQWSQRVPWWRNDNDNDNEVEDNVADDVSDNESEGVRPGDGGARGVEVRDGVDGVGGQWSGLERVIWRVEASTGRFGSTGVYDLAQGQRWWLERVLD